ncbi:hypothetical protein GALMADRAFT_138550 [Galerina marginata CBS 339.88]|uniref:Uncharacterized protein n=1 Tax=Galerina marginata (strain CBS 339.88) TaxID=685588 RepID=A0A067TC56_GALM3|nr:hypothetical protein GALMADRAFT_138550 [Galerina marginata CBS 339.88]
MIVHSAANSVKSIGQLGNLSNGQAHIKLETLMFNVNFQPLALARPSTSSLTPNLRSPPFTFKAVACFCIGSAQSCLLSSSITSLLCSSSCLQHRPPAISQSRLLPVVVIVAVAHYCPFPPGSLVRFVNGTGSYLYLEDDRIFKSKLATMSRRDAALSQTVPNFRPHQTTHPHRLLLAKLPGAPVIPVPKSALSSVSLTHSQANHAVPWFSITQSSFISTTPPPPRPPADYDVRTKPPIRPAFRGP